MVDFVRDVLEETCDDIRIRQAITLEGWGSAESSVTSAGILAGRQTKGDAIERVEGRTDVHVRAEKVVGLHGLPRVEPPVCATYIRRERSHRQPQIRKLVRERRSRNRLKQTVASEGAGLPGPTLQD